MSYKKIKEELVVLFGQDSEGRNLRIAIQRHVSVCPDCAQKAEHTRKIVTVVRERCSKPEVPSELRQRILDHLRRLSQQTQ